MNVLELIKNDHSMVDKMFQEIEESIKNNDEEEALAIFQDLKNSLLLHARSEAAAVYDRLLSHEKVKSFAFEGEEEHGLIEELLAKLDETKAVDDSWQGAFTVLKEIVDHHVEEEENELFPKMKKLFSKTQLENMAEEMVLQKEYLSTDEDFSKEEISPMTHKNSGNQTRMRV